MKLALIYAGYGTGQWTLRPPFDARRLLDAAPGLSGTEVQLFGHARELTRLGHAVTIYSRFMEECEVDGVQYRDLDAARERCDVAIAYHDGRPLDGWNASYKVALHQTFLVSNRQQDATYTGADFADLYLTATERVAAHLRNAYGWQHVRVVPNAWDLGEFVRREPVPGRMVFTTSVDRGARRLIEVLPEIARRVPSAHVVMLRRGSPGLCGIEQSERVSIIGPCSRNEVLALLSTASCYAYPCDVPSPTECFPVSLLEACAAGVPTVLAPDDGIEEVFAPGVWLTPAVKGGAWEELFVQAVVEVLSDEKVASKLAEKGKRWAMRYRFAETTKQLCEAVGL